MREKYGLGRRHLVVCVALLALAVPYAFGGLQTSISTDRAIVSGDLVQATSFTATTLNCTTNANGGAVTTGLSGQLVCSDDDAPGTVLWGIVRSIGFNASAYAVGSESDSLAQRISIPLPRAGVLKNLYVTPFGNTSGVNVTVTAMLDGAETALSQQHVGNTDGSNTVSNTASTAAATAGQLFELRFSASGNAANIVYKATVEFQ